MSDDWFSDVGEPPKKVVSIEERKSNWEKGIAHIKNPETRKRVMRQRAEKFAQTNMRKMHERECPICHGTEVDEQARGEMEALFMDWVSAREISEAYDIEKKWVVWHFRFTGKYRAREGNRGGVFKELVRRGMERVQRGGKNAPKIAVRDIIQANNALVMMEGGFKQHIDFTGKLEAIGRQWDSLTAEQTEKMMEQLIRQIANPNRVMLGESAAIPVEAKEVPNVQHDDSRRDGVPDPDEAWWSDTDK